MILFIKKILKKKISWAVLTVLFILIFLGFRGGEGESIFLVQRSDLIQTVSAAGKVKPRQEIDLGFDKSGRISATYVSIGDNVVRGQILATLSTLDIESDILKAESFLNEENIRLREIKNTTPNSYNDAKDKLEASIKDAFVASENAVRSKTDQFFKNIPSSPKFEVSFTDGNFIHYFSVDSNLVLDINSQRLEVENLLNEWRTHLNTDFKDIYMEANYSINSLKKIYSFLDKIALAVNSFASAEYDYESTVSGYKTTVSNARSEVSNALTEIIGAKDELNSAPTVTTGNDFEDILIQESKVSQARANLSSLKASFEKSLIRAPFNGLVVKQDAKAGASINLGDPLISMVALEDMYIEANISEINIGKVSIGDKVYINFDAFPQKEFYGTLSYIEPDDVLVDGIVNYKIRVNIDDFDRSIYDIKSGLTSNLKIETLKKDGVLGLPKHTITKEGDSYFVNKIIGKKEQKVPISVGISGDNGFTEIISGVEEGDTIKF